MARSRPVAAHWKLGPLEEYGQGRAMAWIDDNFDESCYEWAERREQPTLLVPTETHLGLEEAHVEALRPVGPVSTLTPMHGFWPIFFLLVVLKIPVFASLALIWWASREPEPEGAAEDSDGGFKRRNPRAKAPPRPTPRTSRWRCAAIRRGRGAPLGQRRPAPFTSGSRSTSTSMGDHVRPGGNPRATEEGHR